MSNLKAMYSSIQAEVFPDSLKITVGKEELIYKKRIWQIDEKTMGLRYGENPDQPAALYELVKGTLTTGGFSWRQPVDSIVSAITEDQIIQSGKHPGKTNLTDIDNGANILQYLADRPAVAILKHNNPCGVAWSDCGIASAMYNAYWCDRVAAFGGAVVTNRTINKEAAELISENYFEVVAAPAFDDGTIDLLKKRKNLRIFEIPSLAKLEKLTQSAFLDIKSLSDGGLVLQKSFCNRITENSLFLPATATNEEGTEVTTRSATKQELDDLRFAWAVESGVSSNSVIFAMNGATVAIGTGEQDRVGCVELAIQKAYTKFSDAIAFRQKRMSLYELRQKALSDTSLSDVLLEIEKQTVDAKGGLIGSRLVSDGFFPFRDGVDVAIAQGVTAIAQPGGSIRDVEVLKACNEATPQVAMVFTGQRSFKH